MQAFRSTLRPTRVGVNLQRQIHASAPARKHYLDADLKTFVRATAASETENRVVLVDFYADWCGPCRMLSPVLKGMTDGDNAGTDITSSGSPVDLVTIDTETDDGRTLATQHQVRALPTVAAYVNGKLVDSFTGAIPEPKVREWLKRF
ncbi:thioredoxin-like protein [Cylindrobasidium torrendii FP15055 ss-10]|uniref:Thioredoxin-like protein n=1 Tax=Cylindrobasidium torrendii FP15055 ss-10 TaxID=1314674 RepID=A0A0D7BS76_9AGAR|nr:thioredoxin-like protein [Cylindrobasidium torrendii FP15055 ss-10]